MKQVSDAYKQTMDMLIRPTTQWRAMLNMSDSSIPSESTVTYTTPVESFSTGIFDPVHVYDYATLEQDFMQVGSNLHIVPASNPAANGYVGSAIGSAGGVFSTAPQFTVEFTESKRFSALSITFSIDYPTTVTINTYSSGTLVDSRILHPTGLQFTDEYPYALCDKVIISCNNLSAGSHRLRIQSVTFGAVKYFDTSNLISSKHTMEVDPISSSLPQNTLTLQLNNLDKSFDPDNPTSDWEYFENGQPLKIEYGVYINDETDIEWLDGDMLFLSDTPVVDKTTVTFKASDRLSFLTDNYYKGVYNASGVTLYALAEAVFADAGVTDYEIDTALQQVKTVAPMPVLAHRECLQIIANAGRAVLYCDNHGIIHLKTEHESYTEITTNGQTAYSNAQYALSGVEDIAYATLGEGAMRVGDTRLRIAGSPPYHKVGYVSSKASGNNGYFTVEPVFTLKYDTPITGRGISIEFGGVSGINPMQVLVEYYLGTTFVTDEYWDEPNPIPAIDHDATVGTYDKVVITIYQIASAGKPAGGSGLRPIITKINDQQVGDYYLDFAVAYDVPTVSKGELLHAVNMSVHSYSEGTDTIDIYNDEVEVSGTVKIYASYVPSTDISVSVTGATLVSHEEYAETAILELSGSGTASIQITGKPLQIKDSTVDTVINGRGSDCPVDNPLITDIATANAVAEWMGSYLNHRNTYTLEFREDFRLDVNDKIYVKSNFQDMIPTRVTKLQYNLPYSRGGIEVRGLN